MTTLSTHDTKRGEDVRARIGVLSQVPSLWAEFVARWEKATPSPDRIDRTVPVAEHLRHLARRWRGDRRAARAAARIRREGDSGSGACTPRGTIRTPTFEDAVHGWLDAVLDGPVAAELTQLVAQLRAARAQRRAGSEAVAAHGAGRPGCLSGHRTVGGQPRRSGQPQTRRLRRAPRRHWTGSTHPKMRVVDAALRAAARSSGHLPGGRVSAGAAPRCGRRAPGRLPPGRRRPGGGVAAGPCASAKPVGAIPLSPCPKGPGPTGSPGGADRRGLGRRTVRATCPSRCWSGQMADIRGVGAACRTGPARRRRHPARDGARRGRLVARHGGRAHPTPATASCSTTIPPCCPIPAHPGSPTACTSDHSCGRPPRRRGPTRLAGPLRSRAR